MQVVAEGLLTNYQRSGRGRNLVLLHGWGDRAAGLRDLQAELAKNFCVIAPDLPGFGGSAAPAGAWDLTDYATFLKAFLHKIGVGEIYAFVGHSNGGAIAMRGLGQEILAAEKLILLSAAGIRGQYNGRTRALRAVTKTGKVLTAPLPKKLKQKLQQKVYQTVGSDMLVAEHLQATFKKIVSDDVQADAAKLALPALLIYGEDDRQTPVWYGEKFHELIAGSTLEILPGAGHFVHLDRPAAVYATIEEFLR